MSIPLGYSKFFCPAALFILGICAWFCFRQWKLAPLACVLGALASALSSHFLSTAAWGVASQVICVGMSFIATGLLATLGAPGVPGSPAGSQQEFYRHSKLRVWAITALAGLAVGIGVMEGYDIGAIFSLYVAAFAIYHGWITHPGQRMGSLFRSVGRVAVVAVLAGLIAAQVIFVLVVTQIKGVAGTEQTPEAKAARWDFATQWSIPKSEVPRILIPGLFGYRMDTPKDMGMFPGWFEGGVYWGKVGETPGWSEHHTDANWAATHGNTPRFSGGGEYAGVLVVAGALWAVFQSLRKKDSVFSLVQRKLIWFWAVAAFVSLLFALGRYAPFYQFVYMLPYFSTIRNPAKFMHPFHWSLVILFAYSVHGLCRRYLEGFGVLVSGAQGAAGGISGGTSPSLQPAPSPASSKLRRGKEERAGPSPRQSGSGHAGGARRNPAGLRAHLKDWWAKAGAFDINWVRGSVIVFVVNLLAWLIYASSKPRLEQHLRDVGFPDPALAAGIASFSIREVGLYLLFLAVTLALLTVVMSGWFTGRRARWGGILLGVLLVVDLSRANLPWIIYWDYKYKYATNPVIDFLREKPYEHRVALLRQRSVLDEIYGIEWAQHHFQFYNIQSLDVVQMPRETVDFVAFERTHLFDSSAQAMARRWQLTNTRYLLGVAGSLDPLNQQMDPGRHRFQIVERFDIVPKPGETEIKSLEQLTAVTSTNGQYAIFAFNGALPRAKLYTDWQVATNEPAAREQLQAATNAMDLDLLKKVGANDFLTLKNLASPRFDPEKTVLLAAPLSSLPSPLSPTNAPPGTVDFVSYAPKHVVLQAKAAAPSVLLLNDKFDANWKVTVDGKPEKLLRCNYIMRGVQVPPGDHRIEFRFEPPIASLYVSLAAIALGLGLIGFLAVLARSERRAAVGAAPRD